MFKEVLEFINNNHGVSILIASLSAFISAIAVAVAIYYNSRTQRQYKESRKPQLSMRLDNYNGFLYLFIQNAGGTAAKEISAKIIAIENNGFQNELCLDALFEQSFELYPQETTQGRVAFWGGSISEPDVFPTVSLNVNYKIPGVKKKQSYSRKVTFSKYFDTKVLADVNINLKEIEDSLDTTTRAAVRIANYLDGCQVAPFDKLNILANKSLQNDMCSAFEKAQREPIKDRTTTITFALKRVDEINSDDRQPIAPKKGAPHDE